MSAEAALASALDERAPDRREHIRWLIESAEPGLDERIQVMLRDRPDYKSVPPEQRGDVMWVGMIRSHVLSRVLIERQPDMDPAIAFEARFGPGEDQSRLAKRVYGRMAVSHLSSGFARLRRADPVERYAAGTTRWWGMWRAIAVHALGDTADPAALPWLSKALRDRDAQTRGTAVNAIRRLHRHGAVPSADSVADRLVKLLAQRKTVIAECAAVALVELGETDRLVAARRTRPEVIDAALAGEIPPLPGLWPGEVHYVAPRRK